MGKLYLYLDDFSLRLRIKHNLALATFSSTQWKKVDERETIKKEGGLNK